MKQTGILFKPFLVRKIVERQKIRTRRLADKTTTDWVEKDGFTLKYCADPGNGLSRHGYAGDQLLIKEPHYRYGSWEIKEGEFRKNRQPALQLVFHTDEVRFLDDQQPMNRIGKRGIVGVEAWHLVSPLFHQFKDVRYCLEIQEATLERIQDIDGAQVYEEGFGEQVTFAWGDLWDEWEISQVDIFRDAWKTINGPLAWDLNPLVWNYRFKLL